MFTEFFLAFLVVLLFYHLFWKRRYLPPGPTPLPFIGNIHQFDISNAEQQLLEYRNRYGKMFTLWLPEPYVFFGDYELIKSSFKKDEFSGRPKMEVMKLIVEGPFGLVINENLWWKSQRRFALHVLRDFGIGKPILESATIHESRNLVDHLNATKAKPCELHPVVLNAVGNIICQLIFGFTRELDDPFIHEVEEDSMITVEFFNSAKMFVIEQCPQAARFMDLKRILQSNDRVLGKLQEQIDIHKKTIDYGEAPRDYIDAFLMEMRKREEEGDLGEFTEHQLKVSLYDLFFAGLETTVTTLRHAILRMIRNPEIQAKVHEEIDRVLGRETEVTMKDQTRLPYVNAVIQETQRISNVVVLNVPHTTTENVKIEGFRIPKNTIVIPQYPLVHMDPTEFENPNEFRPDRFLNSKGQFVKDERVIPFSIGKRMCLGEGVARMELFIYFTTMLQKFEFRPEIDGKTPPLDFVVLATKAPKPFKMRAIPRV